MSDDNDELIRKPKIDVLIDSVEADCQNPAASIAASVVLQIIAAYREKSRGWPLGELSTSMLKFELRRRASAKRSKET